MAAAAAGCASRATARFLPVSSDQAARAVEAWQRALARVLAPADTNLLYEATLSQGMLRTDGTLAVRLRKDRVEGTLAGPFGSPIARYENGELTGEKLAPVRLEPEQLRALLAGVWIGTVPAVAGEDGSEVLLRFPGEEAAEGIFDVAESQLLSLRVSRPEGDLVAHFSGARDPWPSKIEIEEERSGSKLRLTLIGRESTP